ncbi:MAG: HupE/UreJ family protein [Luteolibacter sp.]
MKLAAKHERQHVPSEHWVKRTSRPKPALRPTGCRLDSVDKISTLRVFLILLLLQSNAHAHLTVEGAGEVGSGALHPLMTPAHVLILLGLGLMLGQRVPLDLKTPLQVLAPASAIALLATTTGKIAGVYPPILIGTAMGIAVLVALEMKIPALVCRVICAIAAVGIGLDSGLETGTAIVVGKTLAGTWISMNIAAAYIAICASHGAEKPWAKTGIRVIGSWIIAISLLVLAFSLRK